jgi:autotransporter-associated beta strand protein
VTLTPNRIVHSTMTTITVSGITSNGNHLVFLPSGSRSCAGAAFARATQLGDTISNGSLTATSYAAGNTTGNAIISANLLVNASAGFTKTGAGTVTLTGANTYTGATTVNGGAFAIGGSGTLASSSAMVLGGGQLNLGATTQVVGAVSITAASGSGDTILNGVLDGTSFAASNPSGTAVISANLQGSGTFSKSGAGAVTLSGTNTYTGNTTVTGGTLNLSGTLTGNTTSSLRVSSFERGLLSSVGLRLYKVSEYVMKTSTQCQATGERMGNEQVEKWSQIACQR